MFFLANAFHNNTKKMMVVNRDISIQLLGMLVLTAISGV